MTAFVFIAFFDKNLQLHVAAGASGEVVLHHGEITGHQGEKIGGLRVRIMPGDGCAAAVNDGLFRQIAIGQHNGIACAIPDNGGGENGHDIRPVKIIGDAAKPLRLALRTEISA